MGLDVLRESLPDFINYDQAVALRARWFLLKGDI